MAGVTITFDTRDLEKFKKTCKVIGEKTALKAARISAQKGSNVVGKSIRKAAPVGETGQLKRGFKKKKEKSRKTGKFVYDYMLDPAKNEIFQKPIKRPGLYGGKNSKAYYPSSVEYGFLVKEKGSTGYRYQPPGKKGVGKSNASHRKVEGQYFIKKASTAAEPQAVETMKRVLNEELDKAWMSK